MTLLILFCIIAILVAFLTGVKAILHATKYVAFGDRKDAYVSLIFLLMMGITTYITSLFL